MHSVVIFLVAALLAYTVNIILVRFSKKLGALSEGNKRGELRWASHSKPLVGGIVFFLIFLVAALLLYIVQDLLVVGPGLGFVALVIAGTIAFVVGLSDDAYNTTPGLKFLGQLSCGILLIAFGQGVSFSGIALLDHGLTLLWVVGIMNSFNMLDNMDGVSGSLSFGIITTTATSLVLFGLGGGFYFYLLLAMAGAHMGFLVLNWRPSKLYMGDTGSQFLGLFLAFIGIQFFWNLPAEGLQSLQRQFLLPQLVFLPTIMDTTFVTVARLARRQSPFVGGKDHISHHLVYVGLPERFVPVVFGGLTLLSGAIALYAMRFVAGWQTLYSVLVLAYVAVVFVVFAIVYRLGAKAHTSGQLPLTPKKLVARSPRNKTLARSH